LVFSDLGLFVTFETGLGSFATGFVIFTTGIGSFATGFVIFATGLGSLLVDFAASILLEFVATTFALGLDF